MSILVRENAIMSIRGWIETIDKFAPRCARCNRKIRSGMQCKVCGVKFCSESCSEKHITAYHADVLAKRQADAEVKRLADEETARREAIATGLEAEAARIRGAKPKLTASQTLLVGCGVFCGLGAVIAAVVGSCLCCGLLGSGPR